jgi:hypothetical protein
LSTFTSFVGLAAMPHSNDIHNAVSIIDLIDYPVIADTHTPTILCAYEFTTA